MKRRTVTLREDEYAALRVLAEQQRRDLRDQAAILIRCELQRRGLLRPTNQQVPGCVAHESESEAVSP